MKALKKIACTIGIVAVILIEEIFRGAGGWKPNDRITRAIYDEVGKKELVYQGNKEILAEVQYTYELKKKDAKTIPEFVKAFNGALGDEQKDIRVNIYAKLSRCREISVCSLSNHHNNTLEEAGYDGLWSLRIGSLDELDDLFPESPFLYYMGIEGIRHLEIDAYTQRRAEKEGIDWYECWPELEEVTVIGSDSENIW